MSLREEFYREELRKKLRDEYGYEIINGNIFYLIKVDEKSLLDLICSELQEKDKVIEELQEKLKPPVCHDVEKYYEEEI